MRPARSDLRRLARVTEDEGKHLALMVRRGQATRAQIEKARARWPNDAEPVIALQWVDRWEP
jgi:hypothetical protein